MPDPLIQPGDEFLYVWRTADPQPWVKEVHVGHPHVYCVQDEDGASVSRDVIAIRRDGRFVGYTCPLCRYRLRLMMRVIFGDPRDHMWLCPAHEAEMRQAMEGM